MFQNRNILGCLGLLSSNGKSTKYQPKFDGTLDFVKKCHWHLAKNVPKRWSGPTLGLSPTFGAHIFPLSPLFSMDKCQFRLWPPVCTYLGVLRHYSHP